MNIMTLKNYQFYFIILFCITTMLNSQFAHAEKKDINHSGSTSQSLLRGCRDSAAIEKIIGDAIELGAPVYNAGLHIECYRVYEWASYKIIHVYGGNCKNIEKILNASIEKSHGDYSDVEKAWIMRMAFDKILGVPTQTGNSENISPEKEPSLLKG